MRQTSVIKAGLIVLLAATSLSACKKNENAPGAVSGQTQVSFTLNGDGYSNEQVSISGTGGLPHIGGTYVSTPKFTVVSVDDAKNVFTAVLDGQKTGNQNLGTTLASASGDGQDEVDIVLTLNHNGKQQVYDSNGDGFGIAPKGTITVTQYGVVGNTITGTFSGTLVNQVTGATLTVSGGSFSVTRLKDVTTED